VRHGHYASYRSVGFPRLEMGVMTQHESAIVRQPLTDLSLFEANIWGMLFYVTELDEKEYTKHLSGIHAYSFVGHLLLFLRHASDLFRLTGLNGPILVEASLQAIKDCKWVYAHSIAEGFPSQGATKLISGLDDAFGLSVSTTVENLREKPDDVAIELLRSIFFSLNWSDLVDTQGKLETLIRRGHEFNGVYVRMTRDISKRAGFEFVVPSTRVSAFALTTKMPCPPRHGDRRRKFPSPACAPSHCLHPYRSEVGR
jgi:hypothetical protein